MPRSTIRRATVVAASTLLLGAGTAEASTLHGVVVHRNARAHSFTVADRSGRLYAVHARRQPRLGRTVTLNVRRLRNGTYDLRHSRVASVARGRVRIRGVVTFVNRRRGVFTVSATGVSMLVRRRHALARAADALPSVGSVVVAAGTVDDQGELDESSVSTQSGDANRLPVEGTVVSVDQTAGTIVITADDTDASGSTITVTVPSGLDPTQFVVGQEVALQVQQQSDGSFVLIGSAPDESAQSADGQGDQQDGQGDGNPAGGSTTTTTTSTTTETTSTGTASTTSSTATESSSTSSDQTESSGDDGSDESTDETTATTTTTTATTTTSSSETRSSGGEDD